jgi:hypothetical protein
VNALNSAIVEILCDWLLCKYNFSFVGLVEINVWKNSSGKIEWNLYNMVPFYVIGVTLINFGETSYVETAKFR